MAKVAARRSRELPVAPEQVLEFLRDYRERGKILTDNYSAYRVESGGRGDGTVIGYHFAAGGRERDYRQSVQEADGALHEHDQLSSFVSIWSVAPAGAGSKVTLEGSWDGAGGSPGSSKDCSRRWACAGSTGRCWSGSPRPSAADRRDASPRPPDSPTRCAGG
jgi:hypothetical protein